MKLAIFNIFIVILFSWILQLFFKNLILQKYKNYILLKIAPINNRTEEYLDSFVSDILILIILLIQIILSIINLVLNKEALDYWLYRFSTIDIALIFPAYYAYTAFMGAIIYVFYICLRCERDKVVISSKLSKIAYIIEYFIWIAVFYNILVFYFYDKSFLIAILFSIVYSMYRLSYQVDRLIKIRIPYYTLFSDFILTLFSCMLFILTENIIVPFILFLFILFSLAMSNKTSVLNINKKIFRKIS